MAIEFDKIASKKSEKKFDIFKQYCLSEEPAIIRKCNDFMNSVASISNSINDAKQSKDHYTQIALEQIKILESLVEIFLNENNISLSGNSENLPHPPL